MKRTLLVLSLAMLALPLSAQKLADSSDSYVWDVNQWEHHLRRTYTYNGSGQYLQVKEFDALSGQLENQLDYSYAPSGKIAQLDVMVNNGTQMVPGYRYIYTYDSHGNQVLNRREEFVAMAWEIVSGDSISYVYDGMDRVTEYTIHKYTTHDVQPSQKFLWADFGTDSLPRKLTIQNFHVSFQNFIEFRYISWKGGFDLVSFNPSSYFGYSWNGFAWDLSVYDSAIMANGKHQVNYLFEAGSMDTIGRTDYVYDAKGFLRDKINLNFIGNQWFVNDGSRDSIKYGGHDEIQERIYSTYNTISNQWNYVQKEVYYYHPGVGFDNPNSLTLKVYPNPCRDYFIIETEEGLENLRLTDMQGRNFPVEMLDGKISTAGMTPGIYRLSASGSKGNYGVQLLVMP